TSAKSYEQFIKNFWTWNTIPSHHGVRGQSAFDVAEQIEEGTWMIPTSTSQSHDLRRQPPADPPPSGRDILDGRQVRCTAEVSISGSGAMIQDRRKSTIRPAPIA